jgi:hypothetical protein
MRACWRRSRVWRTLCCCRTCAPARREGLRCLRRTVCTLPAGAHLFAGTGQGDVGQKDSRGTLPAALARVVSTIPVAPQAVEEKEMLVSTLREDLRRTVSQLGTLGRYAPHEASAVAQVDEAAASRREVHACKLVAWGAALRFISRACSSRTCSNRARTWSSCWRRVQDACDSLSVLTRLPRADTQERGRSVDGRAEGTRRNRRRRTSRCCAFVERSAGLPLTIHRRRPARPRSSARRTSGSPCLRDTVRTSRSARPLRR